VLIGIKSNKVQLLVLIIQYIYNFARPTDQPIFIRVTPPCRLVWKQQNHTQLLEIVTVQVLLPTGTKFKSSITKGGIFEEFIKMT
jgi:hypothetical protein